MNEIHTQTAVPAGDAPVDFEPMDRGAFLLKGVLAAGALYGASTVGLEYRHLGRSPLKVSALCLGTMMFGDQTDAAEARAIIADARDAGRQLHRHCRRLHAAARPRSMVGELIGPRHDWVLATKLGNKMSERPNEAAYSRRWMLRGVRCQPAAPRTDHVDIHYMHRDDNGMRSRGAAAGDRRPAARRQDPLLGRVQLPRLAHRRGRARARGSWACRGPVVCQPYYNLLNRMPEVEMLPACDHYGIGVAPYSPIARGVLDRQVRAGRAAGRGHARRPRRSSG